VCKGTWAGPKDLRMRLEPVFPRSPGVKRCKDVQTTE
jgi:hypothetical protein